MRNIDDNSVIKQNIDSNPVTEQVCTYFHEKNNSYEKFVFDYLLSKKNILCKANTLDTLEKKIESNRSEYATFDNLIYYIFSRLTHFQNRARTAKPNSDVAKIIKPPANAKSRYKKSRYKLIWRERQGFMLLNLQHMLNRRKFGQKRQGETKQEGSYFSPHLLDFLISNNLASLLGAMLDMPIIRNKDLDNHQVLKNKVRGLRKMIKNFLQDSKHQNWLYELAGRNEDKSCLHKIQDIVSSLDSKSANQPSRKRKRSSDLDTRKRRKVDSPSNHSQNSGGWESFEVTTDGRGQLTFFKIDKNLALSSTHLFGGSRRLQAPGGQRESGRAEALTFLETLQGKHCG